MGLTMMFSGFKETSIYMLLTCLIPPRYSFLCPPALIRIKFVVVVVW